MNYSYYAPGTARRDTTLALDTSLFGESIYNANTGVVPYGTDLPANLGAGTGASLGSALGQVVDSLATAGGRLVSESPGLVLGAVVLAWALFRTPPKFRRGV